MKSFVKCNVKRIFYVNITFSISIVFALQYFLRKDVRPKVSKVLANTNGLRKMNMTSTRNIQFLNIYKMIESNGLTIEQVETIRFPLHL